MSRRNDTTEHLRAAAFDELLDAGPRALSIAGIARRAYFSEAAVYQRWANRREALDDVVATMIVPRLSRLVAGFDAANLGVGELDRWFTTTVADTEAVRTLHAVAELAFAARDEPELHESASAAITTVLESVPVGGLDESAGAGLRWWCTGYVLGHALLTRCGCAIPELTASAAAAIRCAVECDPALVGPPQVGPAVVEPRSAARADLPDDDVTAALLAAGRRRVLGDGLSATTVRAVAADAGVTTGALYRRWTGRHELLQSLVATEGLGDQYRWLLTLLSSAADGVETPAGRAALERAATVARQVWSDPQSKAFLLEMAVAAHTSEPVRSQLEAQVQIVVDARTAELEDAVDAGLVCSSMTPREITWFLQTPPVALRLMSDLGIEPTHDEHVALLGLFATVLWSGAVGDR